MPSYRSLTRRGERGQATVEFAILLPLVLVVLIALVQVALLAYVQLDVTHAAREAARALAADSSTDLEALERRVGYQVQIAFVADGSTPDREVVQVVIVEPLRPVSPLFEALVGGVQVRAQARMLVE